MIPMMHIEPTPKNIRFADKFADLCSDYELGFLTDDGFEVELKKLHTKYGDLDE